MIPPGLSISEESWAQIKQDEERAYHILRKQHEDETVASDETPGTPAIKDTTTIQPDQGG